MNQYVEIAELILRWVYIECQEKSDKIMWFLREKSKGQTVYLSDDLAVWESNWLKVP